MFSPVEDLAVVDFAVVDFTRSPKTKIAKIRFKEGQGTLANSTTLTVSCSLEIGDVSLLLAELRIHAKLGIRLVVFRLPMQLPTLSTEVASIFPALLPLVQEWLILR